MLGLSAQVSDALPLDPDHREDARRMVRHGLRQWVEYIGEDVGPRPGEPTHALRFGPTLVVSRELFERLRGQL